MGDLLRLGQPKTRLSALSDAHLDPDLDSKAINRTGTWMPAFGQAKTAAKHLHKQGVGHGDLFLFFGWFQKIKRNGTTWSFVSAEPGQNVIFGWLQIEHVGTSANLSSLLQQFPGLCTHPHCVGQRPSNTLYIASARLSLPWLQKTYSGGGHFDQFLPKRVLTAQGQPNRSYWRLPGWATGPNAKPPLMTYHKNSNRWRQVGNDWFLQTTSPGQEFVTQADPNILKWVSSLF
jgi:hypothetical protein